MAARWSTEDFDIATDQKSAAAGADFYIPFAISRTDPVKSARIGGFKARLRTAIQTLRPREGEVLLAQYAEGGEKDRFFDLENMLFYNVGASAFAACAMYGIAFSRLPDRAAFCQRNGIQNREYVYSYQCLPLAGVESLFSGLPPLANWRDVPLNRQEADTPAKYWKALRGERDRVTAFARAESSVSDGFALRIDLRLPDRIRLANRIKPLLDGVICAFHGENAQVQACLNDFCTRQHCEELSAPRRFPAVLGERAYIRPYRHGQSFSWNPADHLCGLALVTVSYGGRTPLFSGEIYQM